MKQAIRGTVTVMNTSRDITNWMMGSQRRLLLPVRRDCFENRARITMEMMMRPMSTKKIIMSANPTIMNVITNLSFLNKLFGLSLGTN